MKLFEDYKIILPIEVRERIQYYVDKADKEVSGLGDAWLDKEEKTINVTSAFLLDQECTASDTELDDEAIAKAMFKAHKDSEEGRVRNLKFWWHSHVNMGVFWSGTDVEAMAKLSSHGWFCNIVFNKKREMLGAISYPVKIEAMGEISDKVIYENKIKIETSYSFTEEEKKAMDEHFDANYKEKTYSYTPNKNYYSGPYQDEVPYKRVGVATYCTRLKRMVYENVAKEPIYHPGEETPDKDIVLFADEKWEVIEEKTKEKDVFYRQAGQKGYHEYVTIPSQLPVYVLKHLDYEVLERIYDGLTQEKKFKDMRKLEHIMDVKLADEYGWSGQQYLEELKEYEKAIGVYQ